MTETEAVGEGLSFAEARRYEAMMQADGGVEFVEAAFVLASDYDKLLAELEKTKLELEAAQCTVAIQWDDCSEDTIKSLRRAVKQSNEELVQTDAALAGWEDTYLAFVGAFDTPVMRHKVANEYAEDARQRVRAFNEAVGALRSRGRPPAASEPSAWATGTLLWNSEADARRHATCFDLEVVPVYDSLHTIKESDCHG